MGLIVWLLIGGFVGWIASLIMKTDAQQGWILNVIVGIVGAMIAGFFGAGNINGGISVISIAASVLGAVALLAVVKLVRRAT
ncbi:MAG: GlsB/YeaQ/YmgE family stress response membrane protein [Brachymonas sp.]|nr:GlsB/YeaQ/YmgE family stress response membrane protein [Brachymonas sp.]